ncbi:MAG: MBL fold metallo-hydrolase [Candidatus Roizmanbacteria bacterium]|nr:MBL fold metallo-hydrolase [Candidatus Roizmanbacteria bacterium]
MHTRTYPLGELQANCYLLTKGTDALIIDPGDSADFLLELVSREQLRVWGILATHGHYDHVLAAGELQASLDIPLYIGEKDVFLVKKTEKTAEHFMSVKPIILPVQGMQFLEEKGYTLGPFSFQAIPAPGHTPGSFSFYFESENALFVGDVMFADNTYGSTTHRYSNKQDLERSIQKLKAVSFAIVYPGHGTSMVLQ